VLTEQVTIINRLGLHARAAARFVQTAAAYPCEVSVVKAGNKVNGKSIMGLMMLAAGKGSKVKFLATGEDAAQMLAELEQLFGRKFDET
jgi:phosphocarrier protein